MPEMCPRYAREICMRYAWDMHEICVTYAWHMPDICRRYAWEMPERCLRYARDMPEICLRYAWDMPEIFPRNDWQIPERCTWLWLGWNKSRTWWEADCVTEWLTDWLSDWLSDEAVTRDAYASKKVDFLHAGIFLWEENIMFSRPDTQTKIGRAMGILLFSGIL